MKAIIFDFVYFSLDLALE